MDRANPALAMESIALPEPESDPRERLRRAFSRNGDALYRYILFRIGGSRDAADDLLQQTCHEAARHPRLRRPEGNH